MMVRTDARVRTVRLAAPSKDASESYELPKSRKRALTIPLPPCSKLAFLKPWSFKQRTIQQVNSQLCRLPLELRRLIYEIVVSSIGHVIHIFELNGVIRHMGCDSMDLDNLAVGFLTIHPSSVMILEQRMRSASPAS